MGRDGVDRQALRLLRRRRHRPLLRRLRRRGARGKPGRARALRPHPGTAVPDAGRDQRRLPGRRRRDRAALRLPHDRELGAALRLPGGLPRALPGVGRHAARSEDRRSGRRSSLHRRESPTPKPDAYRCRGRVSRARRRGAASRGVSRRFRRTPGAKNRARSARPEGQSLGRGRRRPDRQGQAPAGRLAARGSPGPLRGGRPDRGRERNGAWRRAMRPRKTQSPSSCPAARPRPRSTPSTSSSAARRRTSASRTPRRGRSKRSESSGQG